MVQLGEVDRHAGPRSAGHPGHDGPRTASFGIPAASVEIVLEERLPGGHAARVGVVARLDHHPMLGATGSRT